MAHFLLLEQGEEGRLLQWSCWAFRSSEGGSQDLIALCTIICTLPQTHVLHFIFLYYILKQRSIISIATVNNFQYYHCFQQNSRSTFEREVVIQQALLGLWCKCATRWHITDNVTGFQEITCGTALENRKKSKLKRLKVLHFPALP